MNTSQFDEQRKAIKAEMEAAIAQIRDTARMRLDAVDQSEQLFKVASGVASGVDSPEQKPSTQASRPTRKRAKTRKRKGPTLRMKLLKAIEQISADDFTLGDVMPLMPKKTNIGSARKCLTRMAQDPEDDVWLKEAGKPYEAAIYTKKRPVPAPVEVPPDRGAVSTERFSGLRQIGGGD